MQKTGLAALVPLAVGVLLAGCGSSGQSSQSQSSQAPSPQFQSQSQYAQSQQSQSQQSRSQQSQSQQSQSQQPGSAGSTVDAVTSAFTTFFDGKTGASTKVGLLQNGPKFTKAIKGQAGSGLAKSSSVQVSKVTVTSAGRASVVYTVLLGGQPALKDQSGTAVREGGTWKVSAATFCSLLTLEGQAPAACPGSSASSATG